MQHCYKKHYFFHIILLYQPSSSGRAAALISKDGTVGFVGFGGLQGSPGASNLGYVPMSTGVSEDVDASVDGEFRMVMRKLMKRDSVTKLKVNLFHPITIYC